MSANPARDPNRRVHHEYDEERKRNDRQKNRNNAARRADITERLNALRDDNPFWEPDLENSGVPRDWTEALCDAEDWELASSNIVLVPSPEE